LADEHAISVMISNGPGRTQVGGACLRTPTQPRGPRCYGCILAYPAVRGQKPTDTSRASRRAGSMAGAAGVLEVVHKWVRATGRPRGGAARGSVVRVEVEGGRPSLALGRPLRQGGLAAAQELLEMLGQHDESRPATQRRRHVDRLELAGPNRGSDPI